MDTAFTAVMVGTGWTIGTAERDTKGYTYDTIFGEPMFLYQTYAEAEKASGALNNVLGLTPYEAFKIVASSMRK
jgi:hypothetical protein